MMELRKRKGRCGGRSQGFLENIESGMGHSTQVEFTKGVHLPDQVRFALDFYRAPSVRSSRNSLPFP